MLPSLLLFGVFVVVWFHIVVYVGGVVGTVIVVRVTDNVGVVSNVVIFRSLCVCTSLCWSLRC